MISDLAQDYKDLLEKKREEIQRNEENKALFGGVDNFRITDDDFRKLAKTMKITHYMSCQYKCWLTSDSYLKDFLDTLEFDSPFDFLVKINLSAFKGNIASLRFSNGQIYDIDVGKLRLGKYYIEDHIARPIYTLKEIDLKEDIGHLPDLRERERIGRKDAPAYIPAPYAIATNKPGIPGHTINKLSNCETKGEKLCSRHLWS